jgi:hypothetical protein
VKIEALAGPDGLPGADELTAIIAALEATAGDAEAPSRWRLAARDFDQFDFELDQQRSRR